MLMFKVMFAIIASWSKYIKIGIMGIICCWLISVPFFLPVSVLFDEFVCKLGLFWAILKREWNEFTTVVNGNKRQQDQYLTVFWIKTATLLKNSWELGLFWAYLFNFHHNKCTNIRGEQGGLIWLTQNLT
jgi:hypothetical protein